VKLYKLNRAYISALDMPYLVEASEEDIIEQLYYMAQKYQKSDDDPLPSLEEFKQEFRYLLEREVN